MQEVDDLLNKLLPNTYTKASLMRRTRLLKDFINFKLFENQPNIDPSLLINSFFSRYHDYQQEQNWLITIGTQPFTIFNRDNAAPIFQELEKQFKELPIVVLYLPFPLVEGYIWMRDQKDSSELNVLTQVGGWFKTNLGSKYLFEINYDPDLVGGCAFSFKGVYRDYSLKAKINSKRDTILTSLKEFKKR